MSKLVIAEKPKMAQAIAAALGVPPSKEKRGLYTNREFRITSCQGHLLMEFMPADYDEKYKQWKLEDLPIRPDKFQMKADPNKKRYMDLIKSELNHCKSIINAGDIDAAGQCIVDDVLGFLGWNGPVERVLINDLNPEPIQMAFTKLQDNNHPQFRGLHKRELGRRRGDWLLGLNLTRLYTVLGKSVGIDLTLSVGRVQSAILGLVVKRAHAIETHKATDFFTINGKAEIDNVSFPVKWQPTKATGLNEEGLLIDLALAKSICQKSPIECVVKKFDKKQIKVNPPLAFALSDLQKECSKSLDMTLQEVMDTCQSLYEKHGLITYPRTDTAYLPEEHFNQFEKVRSALTVNTPDIDGLKAADPSIKSRAFDDKKITAHHGIIPTYKAMSGGLAKLNPSEKAVYEIIAQRYIALFHPPGIYERKDVLIESSCGESFSASSKEYITEGWTALYPKKDSELKESEDLSPIHLPDLSVGTKATVDHLSCEKKKTQPPKPYTDASLISAMINIDKHVLNKEIAALLKDSKGIGTEATRSGILEKLVTHQLIERKKKSYWPTTLGKYHYSLLPREIVEPDMAALFELKNRQIEQGELSIESFLDIIYGFTQSQVQAQSEWITNAKKLALPEAMAQKKGKPCRSCESPMIKAVSKEKKTKLFVCRSCDSLFLNESGKVGVCIKGKLKEQDALEKKARLEERIKDAPPCPECGEPILKNKSSNKDVFYWSCFSCKSAFSDFAGEIGPIYRKRGESFSAGPDGLPCPDCDQAMLRRMTKNKRPILVCQSCDSIAWYDAGKVGKFIKRKGVNQ